MPPWFWGEVGEGGFDFEFKRAFGTTNNFSDANFGCLVGEHTFGFRYRFERPIETIVGDLVVRPFGAEEGPKRAPPFVIGRGRHVVGVAGSVPLVEEAEVGDGGPSSRELGLEPIASN